MQFWPRKRAKSILPSANWPAFRNISGDGARILGFIGYKVGMTHLLINDNNPHSLTKGTEIFCPVTIVECPPLKSPWHIALQLDQDQETFQVSYVDGAPRVLVPGHEYVAFRTSGLERRIAIYPEAQVHKAAGRVRANQWKYAAGRATVTWI